MSQDVGRADIRVAPWELRGALLVRDRGPPGTVRSPMTGRASSSDDAARLMVLLLDAPGLAGAFTLNALIERRAWVSQPRDPRGASHGKHPSWRESRALRRQAECSRIQAGANTRREGVNAELSRGEATNGWCLRQEWSALVRGQATTSAPRPGGSSAVKSPFGHRTLAFPQEVLSGDSNLVAEMPLALRVGM